MATKTKKKVKKPTLADLAPEAKAEVFDKVATLEDERRDLETNIELTRKKLKGLKEKRDGCNATMQQLIWESRHPEAHPIFAAAEAPNRKAKAETNGQTAAVDPVEAWRFMPLAEALPKLKKPILEKILKYEECKTLGGLTHWANKNGDDFTIIEGISKAEAASINKAMDEFWENRRKAEGFDKPQTEPASTNPEANGQAGE